jgi:MtfA peptidase
MNDFLGALVVKLLNLFLCISVVKGFRFSVCSFRRHNPRMFFDLYANWRRKRILSKTRVGEALWRRLWDTLPFLQDLDPSESARLRELAILFLHDKRMHGAADMQLDDGIRLSIALQACLPILNLGLSYYDGWVGVIVYPGGFRVSRTEVDEAGVVHEWQEDLAGEAWARGPVVLSWEDIASGPGTRETPYNVVIHEFAHKLDMLHKDDATGFPLPHREMDARAWVDALESAYGKFCRAVDRGDGRHALDREDKPLPFDAYAAENPAEFFAVMSEAFFVAPARLESAYGRLYRALCAFYRQDPLARAHRKAAD